MTIKNLLTQTARLPSLTVWARAHRARVVAILVTGGLAVVAISCATLSRTIVAPPSIPGASFVGSKSCEQCHEEITKHFKSADHARMLAQGGNALDMGCESCHGPGSIHNQSGGSHHTIVNPKKDPETCFQCHLEKRGQFSLPYHHPLEEGKVTCADCHNPHKGQAIKGGGTALASNDETCFKCHSAQRGPFVFTHDALHEGCASCHEPHGSVNQKMLLSRNQDLCLKCHFQQQTAVGVILIGNVNHATFLARGTCWSGGCHEASHGSKVSPSLRF